MDAKRLEQLGLKVTESEAGLGPEAELELGVPLVNPLTRRPVERVTLTLMGERLIVVEPPELVGLPPLSLGGVASVAQLEEQLNQSFNEALYHLQRRSEELQALGLSPQVNSQTLQLAAELKTDDDFAFALVADKRGNFRVLRATRGNQVIAGDFGQTFELSEFRERRALAGYLLALVNEPGKDGKPLSADSILLFDEVLERFGKGVRAPPRSALELLMVLRVGEVDYRFAAARVAGRTFRGLLAGPQGKVWAERFQLENFPGVRELLAASLHVPLAEVTVVSADT